jgi:hypothetical protein
VVTNCLVCNCAFAQKRSTHVYCSEGCRFIARLERKRYRHWNQVGEREKQIVRCKARKIRDKQPCQVCGSIHAEKHHPHYDDPFHVEWYCRKHHAQVHTQMRRSA